jgi:hypothetical protein
VLAALASFAGQAAVVYKWTDSDGVVHYSDQSVPGAEKIYTSTSSTAGAASSDNSTADSQASGVKKKPGLGFTELSITSPAPDQTFFGDEVVSVNLALTPSLKPDQTITITWRLNGQQIDDLGAAATHFSLPHLDRGTYAIAATITDQETGETLSTNSVNFFVRQPSELSPQHQKP